jgi:hypothetical protein
MDKSNNSIKRERFKNVASRRVQKVLDSIDSLSICANKNNYEYTTADINKMLKTIKRKLRNLELSFTSNTKSIKETFEF